MTTNEWYIITLIITGAAVPLTRLSPRMRYQLPGFLLGFVGMYVLVVEVVPSTPKPFNYVMVWVIGILCGSLIVKTAIEFRRARANS